MKFCLPELWISLIRFWSIVSKRGSHRAFTFFIPKMSFFHTKMCLILNRLPYYIVVASDSSKKLILGLFKITSWIFSTFSGLLTSFGRPDRLALSVTTKVRKPLLNYLRRRCRVWIVFIYLISIVKFIAFLVYIIESNQKMKFSYFSFSKKTEVGCF